MEIHWGHYSYIQSESLFWDCSRGWHSTETALFSLCDHLVMVSDAGNCSVLILLGLSAAFDIVDHNILLNRLKVLAGSALDLFSSYLSERTSSSRVRNSSCYTACLTFGFHKVHSWVPCCSLSPFSLFLAFLIISMLMTFSWSCPTSWIDCPPWLFIPD